jgi:hypothetical protein
VRARWRHDDLDDIHTKVQQAPLLVWQLYLGQ